MSDRNLTKIAKNISELNYRIHTVAEKSHRQPDGVRLVAVSKKQPAERVDQALAAGHRLFGENRVQEAKSRWEERKEEYSDLQLHLIGPLQTNKVKEAVRLFDVIEVLDRPALAEKLASEMERQGHKIPCLIQVNTGSERQKSGVKPGDLPEFLNFCRDHCGLDIRGLMCIPPLHEPPGLHFAFLKQLADDHGLKELSMGMSGDYTQAIAAGATYVRIGTALFGKRDINKG